MKTVAAFLLALTAGAAFGQADPLAAQRSAMEKLAWMPGAWEGQSVTRTPEGEKRSVSSEAIRSAAGGLAIMIQGRHWRQLEGGGRGDVVLDTAGMLTFDAASGKYKFATQLQDGKAGTFDAELKGDVFSWGFPVRGGAIRYDITRENSQWNERGFFCREGAPCVPFFQMTLDRKGDAP
jgi:hypothetical protein